MKSLKLLAAALGAVNLIGFLRYVVFLIQYKLKQNRKHLPLPPGPTPLPVLGSLLDVAKKTDINGNPLVHLALMDIGKKYNGLYGMYLGSGYTIVITKPEVAEEAFCEHVLDNGVQGQGLNTVDRASMQSHGGHHVPTMRIMTRDGQGLLEESKKKKKKNEGTLYFRYCNVIWKLLEKSAWKISCTHYQHQSSGKERSNDYGRSKLRLLGLESTMQKRGRLS